MRILRCSFGHSSRKGERTARLPNLSVGKCTCANISGGPGVGGEQESPLPSPRPLCLSEFILLGLALRQPPCPLNRRVAASTSGLLANARPGGVEFDNPPNHVLLNPFSSQPMRGPIGRGTPTDTMWAGTMWTNENWRWIFFFRELER